MVTGPVRRPRNRSRAVAGSIHNDETAARLGFRGGTVAGSVHMDQFVPLLLEVFGQRWFETGSLSLYFRNATTDGDPVQAAAARPSGQGDGRVPVRMTAYDGTLVADGTASIGNPAEPSAVMGRDLHPVDPAELRILRNIRPGAPLGPIQVTPNRERQLDRIAQDQLTEPLDWYQGASPWGGAVAAPSTTVGLLYADLLAPLKESLGERVGLFGAIEIRYLNGPVRLDARYDVAGEVVAVSQTPKTEVLWYDSWAELHGERVARMRMMLRTMKASSPHYPELSTAGRPSAS